MSDQLRKGWGRGLTGTTQLTPVDGPVTVSALGLGYLAGFTANDCTEWSTDADEALRFKDVAQARRMCRKVNLPLHAGVTLAPEVARG